MIFYLNASTCFKCLQIKIAIKCDRVARKENTDNSMKKKLLVPLFLAGMAIPILASGKEIKGVDAAFIGEFGERQGGQLRGRVLHLLLTLTALAALGVDCGLCPSTLIHPILSGIAPSPIKANQH